MAILRPLLAPVVGPPAFILDASVPAAWLLPGQATDYTDRVFGKMIAGTAAVPGQWPVELASALFAGERQGLRTSREVDTLLLGLDVFRIVADADTPLLSWPDLLAVARNRSVPVSVAAYIELALRLGLPLATIDPTLTAAATAARVPIYTP